MTLPSHLTPLLDLWHRAGRAARDDRKRLLALYGVASTLPALVLGAVLFRALALRPLELSGLIRPLSYVTAPLHGAWLADADLDLLLYVFVQGLVMAALWGVFGGAVSRMAAVHLATGRKESAAAGVAFARRHWGALAGAKAALWAGVLVPAAVAVGAATAARIPGVFGGVIAPAAILVAAAGALAAAVVGSTALVGGFLTTPTIACEDSDAFDAVSRVFGYAAAGMPRMLAVRLLFFGGVLLGAGWRLLRTAGALLVGAVLFQAGAGAAGTERLQRVLSALSEGRSLPAGSGVFDVVAAATLAVVAGGLLALFAADLVARVLCARVGAYLALRQAVDRVPASELRTASASPPRLDAEAAGFVEVARIESERRPGRP